MNLDLLIQIPIAVITGIEKVSIEYDHDSKDKYGRTLAYTYFKRQKLP